jgi:hypothetical protein
VVVVHDDKTNVAGDVPSLLSLSPFSLSSLSPLSPLFFLFSANDNATCVLEESPGKAGAFLSVCFVVRGWCGPDSSGRCWWCLCVLCCCRHWCLCVAVFASFGHYLGEGSSRPRGLQLRTTKQALCDPFAAASLGPVGSGSGCCSG